ncbi:MAG: GDP-fucose synthetase [Chlamydiae bacterium CG10_big_fil_rev_8_21_14_0_10_35_9]|nr:MAG: GDP-fucose synthetase [Chlamydiae bacterium CG10_big_fil_rev_8_21_14_0_10_35_9]
MKVFVTGANGFLGKFLTHSLKKKGYDVHGISSKDCDLTKTEDLFSITESYDQIFHLAAWTQAGDFCLYHPAEQWVINQKINTHVLDWWHERQPQAKLICMGTSCSYDPKMPLTEKNYMQGEPIDSLYTYAMTKRMLLCGLKAMQKQYGHNYLYVIPSTLYGPSYHLDGRQMHFIFDLIRKVIRGHLYNEPVVLWGDGEQKREIIHVEDFVAILINLSQSISNDEVNIGSGKDYSIREFAGKICQHVGFNFEKIQFDTTKYVGARSKILSVEKLTNLYKNIPMKPIDQGLKEVIDWFITNKETLLS